MRRRIRGLSLSIAALAVTWSLVLFIFDGVDVSVSSVRIRSTNPLRPLWIGLTAILTFVVAGGRLRPEELSRRAQAAGAVLLRRATLIACLLSAATVGIGVAFSTRAGIGSDTYGYVSQADLWLNGELKQPKPWMAAVPWREKRWTFSPLGHRPAPGGELAVVPTYSPGLPLLMAFAKAVAGQCALFLVVPLFGAVAVFSTYLIGHRLCAPGCGLTAAALVSTSPAFLAMLVEPLSDVPVMAAWALAFWYVLGRTTPRALAAGLLTSLAIVIRPNLVVLAAPLAAWLLVRDEASGRPTRSRIARVAIFSAAVLPGVALIAYLNNYLYGSPLLSGYGTPGELFAWSRVWTNAWRYVGWYVESQSPLAAAGMLAIGLPLGRWWPHVSDRRVFFLIGAEVALVWFLYLSYLVFDDWGYLRFLLPSWPFLMLGVGSVLIWAAHRIGPRSVLVRATVIATGLVGLVAWQLSFAREAGVFDYQRSEQHEVRLAQLVRAATPANSVVLTIERSGSVRYYAGRETLRYDYLDADTLDRDMAWLETKSVGPYALLDRREVDEFRQKFAGADVLNALDRPLLIYEPRGVQLFDLGPRDAAAKNPLVVRETPSPPLGCVGPEAVQPLRW